MSEQSITKHCSKCREIKSLGEFHKSKTYKDGHRCWCKTCEKEHAQSYQKTTQGKKAHRRACQKYHESEKGRMVSKEYRRRYRKTEKGRQIRIHSAMKYRQHNPLHRKAHLAVLSAIRSHKLPKIHTRQCVFCPQQAEEYHHHLGYAPEHWLDVIPVCIPCHNAIHATNGSPPN